MNYLFLIAISIIWTSCGENHAGGTVEIPNGIQASTLKDSSGTVLPHHELAFVGVNDTAFNPDIFYSNTNQNGEFETVDLPAGKYRLFVNDSASKMGSTILFEKTADTLVYLSLIHI